MEDIILIYKISFCYTGCTPLGADNRVIPGERRFSKMDHLAAIIGVVRKRRGVDLHARTVGAA